MSKRPHEDRAGSGEVGDVFGINRQITKYARAFAQMRKQIGERNRVLAEIYEVIEKRNRALAQIAEHNAERIRAFTQIYEQNAERLRAFTQIHEQVGEKARAFARMHRQITEQRARMFKGLTGRLELINNLSRVWEELDGCRELAIKLPDLSRPEIESLECHPMLQPSVSNADLLERIADLQQEVAILRDEVAELREERDDGDELDGLGGSSTIH